MCDVYMLSTFVGLKIIAPSSHLVTEESNPVNMLLSDAVISFTRLANDRNKLRNSLKWMGISIILQFLSIVTQNNDKSILLIEGRNLLFIL